MLEPVQPDGRRVARRRSPSRCRRGSAGTSPQAVVDGFAGKRFIAEQNSRVSLAASADQICTISEFWYAMSRHLAGVPADAEVGHQVGRPDDRLRLEDQRRRGDPGDRTQRLGDRVHLGLVLAGRPHPLEDERDRIQPKALHPEVRQPADQIGELVEDLRVVPVEIPLPGVERRPDPGLRVVVVGEVARREVREHLGQRLLVGVGHLAVGVEMEESAVVLVAVARELGPAMFVCHMVQHQVEGERDPPPAQRARQVTQVVHGAQVVADCAIVHHRVPAVVRPGARLEQRQQVQVRHAKIGQVVDLGGHAAEIPGEQIRVRRIPEHLRMLEPLRISVALEIQQPQIGRSLTEVLGGDPDQPVRHLDGVGWVGPGQAGEQIRPVPTQPRLEHDLIMCGLIGQQIADVWTGHCAQSIARPAWFPEAGPRVGSARAGDKTVGPPRDGHFVEIVSFCRLPGSRFLNSSRKASRN